MSQTNSTNQPHPLSQDLLSQLASKQDVWGPKAFPSPSIIGRECTRQLWYMGRGEQGTDRMDASSILAMEQGNANEPLVMRLLDDLFPGEVTPQVSLPNPEQVGCAEGTCDALTPTHVVEIKRTGLWRFMNIAKQGLEFGDPSYWAQCQLYMAGFDRTKCLFIMVSADYSAVRWQWKRTSHKWTVDGKPPPAIWVEEIERDDALVERLIERARALSKRVEQVSEAARVPREYDPAVVGSGWPCGWCRFKHACQAAGETTIQLQAAA